VAAGPSRPQRPDHPSGRAADLDPDRVWFTRAVRIARRTATGMAGFPPEDWTAALPPVLAEITRRIIAPATTATGSKSPATPAPATRAPPRSTSASSTPALHARLELRGIGPRFLPGGDADRRVVGFLRHPLR
jgi:hypothetical protein